MELAINKNIAPASLAPSVVAGQLQGVVVTLGNQVVANANGLPPVGIATMSTGGSTSDGDTVALVTLAKSGISDVSQLKDKTIAIQTLGSLSEIEIQTLVKKAGLSPGDYKVAPITFPDMPAALRAGRVDAALISEPYWTMLAQQEKLVSLGRIALRRHAQ